MNSSARFGRAPSNSYFANLLHRAADRVAPERPGSAPAFRRASLADGGIHVQEWKGN
jgi:hypothetical protein